MTDARLPERWLNDRRMQRLTDTEWRAFTNALMWSVANRTDGVIPDADLSLVPRLDASIADALVSAGVWARLTGSFLIDGFVVTQTTKAQLDSADKARHAEAEARRAKRAADAAKRAGSAGVSAAQPDVGPDVRGDVGPDVQVDSTRLGQASARTGQAFEEEPPPKSISSNGKPPATLAIVHQEPALVCDECNRETTYQLVPKGPAMVCRKCRFAS